MVKIGENKTVGQPKSGTMRVQNATSTGFGIIYADEIIGHRRVDTYEDLKAIPNWALYDKAGGADISTAKGQLWYVSDQSKMYQLTNINATGTDRTWTEFKGTDSSYSLPMMSTTQLGGAKLGDDTTQTVGANKVSSTANRTYAVQKNASNQLVVNVPWTDTNDNTTYTFTGGTDGSFKVTPSNGTAQTVSIGTPANAEHAAKDSQGNIIHQTYSTKTETSNAIDTLNSKISALTSALVYKGTVNKASDLPTTNVKVGDVYVVATAGMYAGQTCEPGDMIIAQVGGNIPEWTIVQTNIDGAITIRVNEKLTKNCIVIGDDTDTSVVGLAPNTGYLYWDGTKYVWKTPQEFQLSAATSDALGGIKIGFTQTGKKYPVQLGTNNEAYVEVPWTDTDTKYTLPIANNTTLGGIKTNYSPNGKNYAVKTDDAGAAYVSVPWTDTNTTYTPGDGISIKGNVISWSNIVTNKLRDALDEQFPGYLISVNKSAAVEGVSSLSYTTGGNDGGSVEITKIYDTTSTDVDGLASIKAVRSTAADILTEVADTYATIDSVSQNLTNLRDAVNGKVDKVAGKGLSTNDYVDTERNVVRNIESENQFVKSATMNNGVLSVTTISRLETASSSSTEITLMESIKNTEIDTLFK